MVYCVCDLFLGNKLRDLQKLIYVEFNSTPQTSLHSINDLLFLNNMALQRSQLNKSLSFRLIFWVINQIIVVDQI